MYRKFKKTIKQLLKRTRLAEPIRVYLRHRRRKAQEQYWIARGQSPPPPDSFKAEVLRQYATTYQLRILVETGTSSGNMIAALQHHFTRLYSIELKSDRYEIARQRFLGVQHIELFCGDSAIVLPQILAKLGEPALFWLDGHYNPGQAPPDRQVSPILTELVHIFAAPRLGHVIIIDDARLFAPHFGYPSLAEVRSIVNNDNGWDILIKDDIIRLTPRLQ